MFSGALDRWGLWIALALALLGALLLFSSAVEAQDLPEVPSLPQLQLQPCPDIQKLETREIDGLQVDLYPARTSACVLKRLGMLGPAIDYIREIQPRLRLTADKDLLQARESDLATREADSARGALGAANRRADRAEEREQAAVEEMNAWYRAPLFLVTVGVVVTVIVQVAAIAILNAVQND